MGLDAWLTLGVLAAVFLLLAWTNFGADTILFAGMSFLLVTGVIDARDAFSGFSNSGIVTVGILFVVAAGLRDSGAMWLVIQGLLGQCRSVFTAQARILFPVAAVSAFWNNTPLVAVLIPAIQDWARKYNLPLSKLLIPLSYGAILGGMCTLIGTSTNLVVSGLLAEYAKQHNLASLANGLGLFEIAKIGVPCALAGIFYLLLVGGRLLPVRQLSLDTPDSPREYVLEMHVPAGSPLLGKNSADAGLVQQQEIYLMEILRAGRVFDENEAGALQEDDCLVFVGTINSIVELQRTPGLQPAIDERPKLDAAALPHKRCLVEAVVSDSSPMNGKTISDGRFRTRYNAVVIAVARNGERLSQRIGDIVLQAGDTLLLDALPSFVDQQRNSRDFYLVSRIEGFTPPRHERAWVALAILAAMVLAVSFGLVELINGAILASAAMLATHCCSTDEARRSVNWRLLTSIAAAYGIGRAMTVSGAAEGITSQITWLVGICPPQYAPLLALALVHLTTMVATELMTNNAAALLVFPIAASTAEALGVSVLPFVMTVMIAASASFATPIGYQTNLMVYGPGGYKFGDFVRIGLPLNFLIAAICITLIPHIWPF